MEILTKGYLVHSLNSIEEFTIKLSDESNAEKYLIELSKKKLHQEHQKIVFILQDLCNKNIIKSVYIPKNKGLQKQLDNLVRIKKEIKKSLNKIKAFDERFI